MEHPCIMTIKVKRKQRTPQTPDAIVGEARTILDEALDRINPKPSRKTWKPMAEGLARTKGLLNYFQEYLEDNEDQVGWEWATLWICHALAAEGGDVLFADRVYQVLAAEYEHDYLTELARARMCRDFTGEYFLARDHFQRALALWPEGYEVHYQLGILYDLLGMPEYAFAFAEVAHSKAEQFEDSAFRHQARVSYNMAVAMWQAARPYGDIKAYLRRALDEWPEYERAQKLLEALPDNDEADPKGRNSMQRLTEDIRKNLNAPSYVVVEPDNDDSDDEDDEDSDD